ncbi:AsmA family protein [Oscillatoria amoena NRMC-F 0135]|nr:AsmA family protein [Oscillatoria amoena NRMC-F 0135]
MKKALKIIAVLLGLFILALGALGFWAYSWLTSDKFKTMLVDKTSEALGVKVTVEELQFSIFSGFELRGVKIASPEGAKNPDFFQADSFVLHYQWRALLNQKLEINEVALVRPTLMLEQLASGQWAVPGRAGEAAPEREMPTAESTTPSKAATESKGVPLSIQKLDIEDGKIVITDNHGISPFSVTGLSLRSSVAVEEGRADLKGEFKAGALNITKIGGLTDLSADFSLKNGIFSFQKFSAKCFSGVMSGEGSLDAAVWGHAPVALTLKGESLDVKSLLQTFGNQTDQLNGKLDIESTITIPTGSPMDFQAAGRLNIREGIVTGVPMLQLIGSVFNISEFQEMSLTKAETDFSVVNRIVTLSNLLLTTSDIRITGGGTITMDNQYDLRLVLNMSKRLYDKMPDDIRERLTPDGDGSFTTPEFRVYGPQNALKTDLLDKLLQKGLEDADKKTTPRNSMTRLAT